MPRCQECHKQFKSITNTHVEKFHSLTLAGYQRKFPGEPIRDEEVKKKMYTNHSEFMRVQRLEGRVKPGPMSKENREAQRARMLKSNPMKRVEVASRAKASRIKNGKTIAPRSEESRKRYSESKKGDKNPMKNPENAMKSAMGHSRKKSSIEKIFDEIILENNLPFEYVGNNQLWIGRKNPDYVCTDPNLRLVLEVTSDAYRRLENDYEPKRIKHFQDNGYRCITVRFTNCQVAYKQKLKDEIGKLLKTFIYEKSSYQIYHTVQAETSSIQL